MANETANEIEKRTQCTGCAHVFREKEAAFCDTCANDDDFNDAIPEGDDAAAATVQAWADRQRLLHGLAPEVFAIFEQCAQDINDGFRG